MRCVKSRRLISTAFDAELSEHERCDLVEHLADCADCRQHHTVLERARELLQEGLVEAPENLEWKVQLGIQRALRERAVEVESPSYGWSFWGRTAASATGMAALVLFAGSFLVHDNGSPLGVPASGSSLPPALLAVERAAEPDLSGAQPVTDFEVDAFRDGYGIRTVSDQQSIGTVGEHYPMAGRRIFQSRANPHFRDSAPNFPSQVLYFRIVPTKLRMSAGTSAGGMESGAVAADSVMMQIDP